MIAESARYFVGGAEKALRFLSAEVRGLHAAAYVLASAALLSSLLALVRDRLLAHTFGASTTLDIYYAAFRVPDLIFVALGALVSVYILIPELVRRDGESQRSYLDTMFVAFSLFAIAVACIAVWIAPSVLERLFPDFVAKGYLPHIVVLTRIMLIQPVLLGLSNILAAITQVKHRYALYALSPLLYNLGIIIGISVLYPLLGMQGLAWGIVLGSLLHFSIQVPSVIGDGFLRRLRIREPLAIVQTVALSLPRALALSMNQVAFLGLTALAATLPAGSIAIFMFGFNLQAVPLAIVGASYSVAAFPTLAAALSKGAYQEFISHVAIAARYVFFWSFPASILILVLRAHIVRVILGSGAFDWTDTRLTAAAFALLALSLASQGLMLLLVRGYYASGRTFVPFIISGAIALSTIGLGTFSIQALAFEPFRHVVEVFLRVEDIPGSSVLGLAFSYAFVTIIGSFVMLAHFEYRFRGFFMQIWRSVWQSLLASLAIGLGAYFSLSAMSVLGETTTALRLMSEGLIAGVVGLVVGAVAYYAIGSREFLEVWASVQGKLWRAPMRKDITLASTAEESPDV